MLPESYPCGSGNNVTNELPGCYQNVTQRLDIRDKETDKNIIVQLPVDSPNIRNAKTYVNQAGGRLCEYKAVFRLSEAAFTTGGKYTLNEEKTEYGGIKDVAEAWDANMRTGGNHDT